MKKLNNTMKLYYIIYEFEGHQYETLKLLTDSQYANIGLPVGANVLSVKEHTK